MAVPNFRYQVTRLETAASQDDDDSLGRANGAI
jgi:hypothetical protein